MQVRVKLAFQNYIVGQVIPSVPALYADDLIARGYVEKVENAEPSKPVDDAPAVTMSYEAIDDQPVKRKRGRPRKVRPQND